MNNKQELIQQIERTLRENQMQMLAILLQDEDQAMLNQILNQIKDEQLKKKFQLHLQTIKQNNKNKKQEIQNQDKIRDINAVLHKQQSDSDQNIVEKQIKKKKQIKVEQKFGYDFYGITKCLMIAYGDLKPKQQSVKIMHSQIQVLFQIIFKAISEIQTDKKISQASIRKIFSNIFRQEVKSFEQITKQYKKAAKASKKKQFIESDSSDDGQFASDNQNKQTLHMNINTIQEGQYFALLTKKMTSKEYQAYSECRSINFLTGNNSKKNTQGLNKFIKFLDSDFGILKPQMRIFQLISFLCCRFVRKIIFKIIRQKNQGKLLEIVEPIQQHQIRKIGNQLIEQYEKLLKSLKQPVQSIREVAKRKFLEDFTTNNFKSIMPRKYAQGKKTGEAIWQQSKLYQQMWEQRLLGERQIDKNIVAIQNDEIDPRTEYGKFIYKYLQFYKVKGSDWLWRKYFTQQKINDSEIKENNNTNEKPKKKVKLESLKD